MSCDLEVETALSVQVDPEGLWGEEGGPALPVDSVGERSGSEAG